MPTVTGPASPAPSPRDPARSEPQSTADPAAAPADDVQVWSHEGDGATAALQPVARDHFSTAPDGSLSLSGPRVNVVMPETVAVRVHEIRMTEVLEAVDSPFERDPRPDAPGRFEATAGTARAGALTAFATSAAVIDDADRWAGHEVKWGDDGQLKVVPYSLVTNFFNSYFHPKERTLALGALGVVEPGADGIAAYAGEVPGWERPSPGLVIDGAASRDIVAHEAAHAVLHAVKPGLAYGVGLGYQEGFADAVSALTALGDPDVVARVLDETGGDLSRSSEVTRVAEEVGVVNEYMRGHGDDTSAMRDLVEDVKLSDLNVQPSSHDVPGMMFVPSRSPHAVGHVFSRAVWDFTKELFDAAVDAGEAPEAAIAHARDVAGTVMMRAARYLPEHHLTFESVAHAMVRVEAEVFGGAHRAALVEAWRGREVLPDDFDADVLLAERAEAVPDFTLPTDVTDPAEVFAHLEAYEAEVHAEAMAASDSGERGPFAGLLWHHPLLPQMEIVSPSELSLYSDTTGEDGFRVVRLAYDTTGASADHEFTAHISMTFDPAGKLTGVQAIRPIFPSF